jgi:hypothetical protein
MYSIDDGRMVMGITLRRINSNSWIVYALGDRGEHDMEKEFQSEEDAYDYMYELIKIDADMMARSKRNKPDNVS